MLVMLAFFMIIVAIAQLIPPIIILALGVFFLQKRNRKRKQEEVPNQHLGLFLLGLVLCIGGAVYFVYGFHNFSVLFDEAIHFKFLEH